MAWQIVIGDGSGVKTLDANMSFAMSTKATLKEDGGVRWIDTIITAAGDTVKSPPGDVADDIVDLRKLVTSGSIVRVRLIQDSVTKWDFMPANYLGTPKIQAFDTIPDDGAGESHWPWQMIIFIRSGTIGGTDTTDEEQTSDTLVLQRTITVEMFESAVIRKIWTIQTQKSTLAQAVAFVKARKPTAKPLRELLTRDGENNIAAATWTWEAARGSIIDYLENPPAFDDGRSNFVIEKRVGEEDPVAHRARIDASRYRFSGVIRAVANPDGSAPKITEPPPRLKADDKTIIREGDDASSLVPFLVDPKQGIYQLNWQQNYIVLVDQAAAQFPDNKDVFAKVEPPDGNFFS